MSNKNERLFAAVKDAVKAIDDKFGTDIKVLDISGISILSDYFIIATAANPRSMNAIWAEVELALHKNDIHLLHSEGTDTGGWVLLDFGTIIIHLFGKEERLYYNLERIWGDAEVVEV